VTRGPRLSGFTLIVLATAIAGAIGYVITWIVPRRVGFADYTIYAVFWSFLFLLVGTLSGIQQEVTRASSSPLKNTVRMGTARAGRFAAVTAILVFAAVGLSSPLWVGSAFGSLGWELAPPLALGAAFYVVVAVIGGLLYGASAWGLLFFLISIEALVRIVGVGAVLLFSTDTVLLAWAVVLPFPVTLAIMWRRLKVVLAGRGQMDVGYGGLIWNVARTIVAAGSLGIMVSGFPFLLGVTSRGADFKNLGLLLLAITLTRAPLIIAVMSLQSFLVVHFRNRSNRIGRSLLFVALAILLAGVVLAAAVWWAGQFMFMLLFPGEPVPAQGLLVALVFSSALVALLCATGPALLSSDRHGLYSIGWALAAVVTVICLLLPLPLSGRTLIALFAGPLAGLLVHGVGLLVAYGPATAAGEPAD